MTLNNLNAVRCLNVAAGDRCAGAAIGYFNAGNLGSAQVDFATESGLHVVTVDSLGLDRVDFIKVDVAQQRVLTGAEETLRRLPSTAVDRTAHRPW